jgi:hypothetical protein
MSEKTTTDKAPQKPTEDLLPPPKLVWQGKTQAIMEADCRLVLKYEWVLHSGAKDWVAEPKIVYEVVSRKAAMGEPIWEQKEIAAVPVDFYLSLLKEMT